MKDIFGLQNILYNLRSSSNRFRREDIKTVHCGLQFVKYLGCKKFESLCQIILSAVIL